MTQEGISIVTPQSVSKESLTELQQSIMAPVAVSRQSIMDPVSEAEGNQWGLDYLQSVMGDLRKLKTRALTEGDHEFVDKINASLLRAEEVKRELEAKVRHSKTH